MSGEIIRAELVDAENLLYDVYYNEIRIAERVTWDDVIQLVDNREEEGQENEA